MAAPGAGVVRGVVYDSVARRPLAGAMVQAVRVENAASARSATTDSAGAFQIDSLAPGRYLLGFLHPTLDLLGVEVTPQVVEVSPGGLLRATLAVPGPARVRAAVCPAGANSDSTGAIAGLVRDADTDAPVTNATVVLTWSEMFIGRGGVQNERHRVPGTVRPDGGFLFCGVPSDAVVSASATAPGRTSGLVEIAAPARGLVVQRFALGPVAEPGGGAADSARAQAGSAAERDGLPAPAPGTARLTGRIVTADGHPVRAARVQIWGTGARDETGPDGQFSLAQLPSGTFTAEVRAIGLEPTKAVVDLARGHTTDVRIAMLKAVPQLDRVVVQGRASASDRDLDGFLARKRTGLGTYYTRADIERRNPLQVTDVLRNAASIHVSPTGSRGYALRGRGGCVPTVYLDGVYVADGADEIDNLVRPEDIAAIEVYGGGGTVPVQFNSTGRGSVMTGNASCGGAVVVWTRH